MRKVSTTVKGKKRNAIKIRYSNKRLSSKWKTRKNHRKRHCDDISNLNQKLNNEKIARRAKRPPISVTAPSNFSLIKNTNDVLAYFHKAERLLKKGENVYLDIKNVESMSADTVALMIANVNHREFMHEGQVTGEAPRKNELNKLFMQSGFYDHVAVHAGFAKKSEGNLLFKKVSKIVENDIAHQAAKLGKIHVYGYEKIFDLLYDVLIECMSNTHDHADNENQAQYFWWLYTHNYPNQCRTGYTFIDLGVGIFKSLIVDGYIRNKIKGTPLLKNVDIVPELLSGTIQSRKTKDNEIRGKGIPEIVAAASDPAFTEFYIISNNVKIDLKTGKAEELKYSLDGTLLYWELCN